MRTQNTRYRNRTSGAHSRTNTIILPPFFIENRRYNPPLPQTQTHITVGFQPARSLVAGDNVTVNLKVPRRLVMSLHSSVSQFEQLILTCWQLPCVCLSGHEEYREQPPENSKVIVVGVVVGGHVGGLGVEVEDKYIHVCLMASVLFKLECNHHPDSFFRGKEDFQPSNVWVHSAGTPVPLTRVNAQRNWGKHIRGHSTGNRCQTRSHNNWHG